MFKKKAISTHFNINLFGDVEKNPEMSFLALLKFFSLTRASSSVFFSIYFGSHLGFSSRHLENWINFDWLTRNYQIVHAYEHIFKVSCLYPEVQDSCHFQLRCFIGLYGTSSFNFTCIFVHTVAVTKNPKMFRFFFPFE